MKSNLGEWLKENAFSILNLGVLLIGFAFQYGQLTAKMATYDDRIADLEKKVADEEKYGHPDHERRIAALEKNAPDFTALKVIVETQSNQINKLADTVSKDHDVLVKFAAILEAKK